MMIILMHWRWQNFNWIPHLLFGIYCKFLWIKFPVIDSKWTHTHRYSDTNTHTRTHFAFEKVKVIFFFVTFKYWMKKICLPFRAYQQHLYHLLFFTSFGCHVSSCILGKRNTITSTAWHFVRAFVCYHSISKYLSGKKRLRSRLNYNFYTKN